MGVLPADLFAPYKQGKRDTSYLTTWLAQTTNLLGLPFPVDNHTPSIKPILKTVKTKKQKKKEEKAEKKTQKSTVASASVDKIVLRVDDFEVLACQIAKHKPIVDIPRSLINTTKRAIDARRQMHNHYLSDPTSDARANHSHGHILQILVDVLGWLEPLFEAQPGSTDAIRDHRSIKCEANRPKIAKTLSNHFEALSVEETSDDFQTSASPKPALVSEGNFLRMHDLPPLKDDEPLYEVEEPTLAPEDELRYAVYSFFDEVDDLLAYVVHFLKLYAKQKVGLVTTMTTVNTAIDIVRKLEKEFRTDHPGTPSGRELQNMGYNIRLTLAGVDFEAVEVDLRSLPKPARGGGHATTYRTGTDDREPLALASPYLEAQQWVLFPTTVMVGLYFRGRNPESVQIPRARDCPWYDKTKSWASLKIREQYAEDQALSYSLMPLFDIYACEELDKLAHDNVTAAFRLLLDEAGKDPSLWALFAIQCYFETHHYLRQDIGRGFDELRDIALTTRATVSEHLRLRRATRTVGAEPEGDIRIQKGIVENIEDAIVKDPFQPVLQRSIVGTDRHWTVVLPRHHFLRNHPILCGMAAFRLRMEVSLEGLSVASESSSLMTCAHLYNAIVSEREKGLMKKAGGTDACQLHVWPAIDLLIKIHRPSKVFLGSPPTEVHQYRKRLLLCMGASLTRLSRSNNRKSNAYEKKYWSRSENHLVADLGVSYTILRASYSKDPDAEGIDFSDIEGILREVYELQRAERDLAGVEEKPYKVEQANAGQTQKLQQARDFVLAAERTRSLTHSQHQRLPPLARLSSFAFRMLHEIQYLEYDYLGAHRECRSLLSCLEKRFDNRDIYGDLQGEPYVQGRHLAFQALWIFAGAVQQEKMFEEMGKKWTHELKNVADQADATCGVMNTLIEMFESWCGEIGFPRSSETPKWR